MWLATEEGFYSVVKVDRERLEHDERPVALPDEVRDLAQEEEDQRLREAVAEAAEAAGGGGLFFVRCRVREDMENLCSLLGLDAGRIVFLGRADYPYRVVLDRGQLAEFMVGAAQTVGYANFKNRVREVSPFREVYYLQCWAALRNLERQDWPNQADVDDPMPLFDGLDDDEEDDDEPAA